MTNIKRGYNLSLVLIAVLVVIIDQLSKFLIKLYYEPGQTVPLIKNFLHLTYVRNPGAAFGLFPGSQTILLIITVIVFAFIIFFQIEIGKDDIFIRIVLGLFLGGTLGNFIDRIQYGLVVDFIDFRFWPVFNFADASIVIGLFLLALYILNIIKPAKEKDVSNIN